MKYTKLHITSIFVLALVCASVSLSASAQIGVGVDANVNANIKSNVMHDNEMRADAGVRAYGRMNASSTHPEGMRRMGSSSDERMEQRMEKGKSKGDKEVTVRIDALNKLLARINGFKNVSAEGKAALTTSLQAEISAMMDLKARIDTNTSTSSIRDDVKSIGKDYRIFALIIPQAQMAAAADRVGTIVTSINTVVGKLQTRVSANATLKTNATILADIADISAKTADANVQAQTAVSATANLQPDKGDKTVMASNLAKLKDAHAQIQAAQKDLQIAQKDLKDIVSIVKASGDMHVNASSSAK